MARVPSLPPSDVEALAIALGECGSGSDIDRILAQCSIPNTSGISTKWRRLEAVFTDLQRNDGCANRIFQFVQSFMAPSRFIGREEEFEAHRAALNLALSFSGWQFGVDGQIRQITAAKTLSEAEARVKTLRSKFQGRSIHPEVIRYCKVELMQDNFFHAVFEACKGLAQRIRDLSGVEGDGAALVDKVFSVQKPILAFNRLVTETERSEQTGYATLLKGCFGAIRNPLAHEPRLFWDGEEDAADIFSMLSLLHRKLDLCVKVPI